MAKLNLPDIGSLANNASARQAINDNFAAIEEAFDNTLSRDGTLPNQMEADIDLNSNDLLNVKRIDASEYYLNGVPWEQQVAYANKQYETLSGTGAQTDFLLNKNPGSLGNLEVSIEGVLQRPGIDFYFVDKTLKFVAAPPTGDDNVLVRYDEALPAGVADAAGLLYTPPSTLVPGSVRSFLDSLWDATTSAGAALIRFIQTGVGAVDRTLLAKVQERLTVADFGAVGDGITDDTVAFQRAISEAITSGRTLYIGQGQFKITSELAYVLTNGQHLSIEGEGSTRTELVFTTTSGTAFNISCATGNWWLNANPQNKVSMRRFSVSTTKTNAGTAFALSLGSLEGRPGPQHVFEELEVRAHDNFTQYFAVAFDMLDCSTVLATGCNVVQGGPGNTTGIGFRVRSTDASTDPPLICFEQCSVVYGDVGWVVTDHVEGIYMTDCTAVDTNQGYVQIVTAESGLHMKGCHFNSFVRNINLGGVGCLLYQNGTDPTFRNITLDNCGSLSLSGNQLRGQGVAGTYGILVSNIVFSGQHGIVIDGNHITFLDVGIGLQSTAARTVVGDNQYLTVNTRVNEASPNTNGNFVRRFEYSDSVVVNFAGGATTETFGVALPTGRFLTKPNVGFVMSETEDMVGVYQFDSGSSTATNMQVKMWKRDGTNITAGAHRLSVMAKE